MARMNRKLAAAFCNLPFTLLAAIEILIYHIPISIACVFIWITTINRSHDHNTHRLNDISDQSIPEPSCSSSKQIERQFSDEMFPPNNQKPTPNLELPRVDADQLDLCSKVGSCSALATPKVYRRSSMIPPEELRKEADDFITNFRRRLRRERKLIKEENNIDFKQRIERGALQNNTKGKRNFMKNNIGYSVLG